MLRLFRQNGQYFLVEVVSLEEIRDREIEKSDGENWGNDDQTVPAYENSIWPEEDPPLPLRF